MKELFIVSLVILVTICYINFNLVFEPNTQMIHVWFICWIISKEILQNDFIREWSCLICKRPLILWTMPFYAKKLEEIGVVSVGWFRLHLSNREQIVAVDGATSSPGIVTCGVPQGSIIGPLFFLCYVNDMATSIEADCKLIVYADDSTMMFAHKDPKVMSERLSKGMEICSEQNVWWIIYSLFI